MSGNKGSPPGRDWQVPGTVQVRVPAGAGEASDPRLATTAAADSDISASPAAAGSLGITNSLSARRLAASKEEKCNPHRVL